MIVISPGASATVDHVEIDGLNRTHACIWHEGTSATVSAINCHGVNDGVFAWGRSPTAGDNLTVRDSYFHGFTTNAANGHIDGVQTEGASHGRIIHNTFDMPAHATSAVAIWNSLRSSDDRVFPTLIKIGRGFPIER